MITGSKFKGLWVLFPPIPARWEVFGVCVKNLEYIYSKQFTTIISKMQLIFNICLQLVNLLTDKNECLAGPCHVRGNCTNTPGSFYCGCDSGFILVNGQQCVGRFTIICYVIQRKILFTHSLAFYMYFRHKRMLDNSLWFKCYMYQYPRNIHLHL